MEKNVSKSNIGPLMAGQEADGGQLASLGCGLGGYWMRFGGPGDDISLLVMEVTFA